MCRCFACLMLAAGIVVGAATFTSIRPEASAAPATQPAATQAAAVNKVCPVSKDPVDAKGPTVTQDGKVVGFCCSDCVAAFKKDPEKYMKDLK